MSRFGRPWIPALLAVGAATLYLSGLHDAPLFVSHDEAVYSLQAQALASTGRDLNGRLLPLYIEYPPQFGRPTWDQPMLIYAIAATLEVLPFSEFSIRVPMALAAVIDVLLMYFVARLLFESDSLATAAAALLALTPAHFMHGRMAIDFQLALPFILGWLLCLLLYVRSGAPRLLLSAGLLLGAGIYSYVIGYLLMPLLAVATCGVLYGRRESPSRYGWLLCGVVLPTLLCLPWMLRHPLPFQDIFAHYAALGDSARGAGSAVGAGPSSQRITEIPGLYASFWDPRFLFIDGPSRFRSTHLMPFFLLPMAGLLAVGFAAAVQRRSAIDALLLFGLLSAPLLASTGGEAQAIWRVLHLAPFGVLLATGGLQLLLGRSQSTQRIQRTQRTQQSPTTPGTPGTQGTPGLDEPPGAQDRGWAATSRPIEWTIIVVVYGLAIGLAVWYHDALPHAQALVRASSLPLGVIGLVLLLDQFDIASVSVSQMAVGAAGVIIATHFVDFIAGPTATAAVIFLIAVVLALLWRKLPDRVRREPLLPLAAAAMGAAQFMYTYVDYGQVHRIGPLPASAIVLAMRLAVASAAFMAFVVVIAIMSRRSLGRLHNRGPAIVAAILCTQIVYFFLDYFADPRLRAVHAIVVLVMAAAVAMSVREPNKRRAARASIAVAGLVGIITLQFSLLCWDYFTESQVRGSADEEGNARIPFEVVLDRARDRQAPSIYLGRIGPYASGDLYWRFYLLKHHREDLLQRTISDLTFRPERIPSLPRGTIVVTSQSQEADSAIDALIAKGLLADRQLVRAPNGSPIFWILETAGH